MAGKVVRARAPSLPSFMGLGGRLLRAVLVLALATYIAVASLLVLVVLSNNHPGSASGEGAAISSWRFLEFLQVPCRAEPGYDLLAFEDQKPVMLPVLDPEEFRNDVGVPRPQIGSTEPSGHREGLGEGEGGEQGDKVSSSAHEPAKEEVDTTLDASTPWVMSFIVQHRR
jgi:hypothetical protein